MSATQEKIEDCPVCACEAGVYGYTENEGKGKKQFYVARKKPLKKYHTGPMAETREEAIALWNERVLQKEAGVQ